MSERNTKSDDRDAFIPRLRGLVGREVAYLGKRCHLVDVLADEGSLVLEVTDAVPPIQTDQYGQAAFRANDTVQIPIFAEDEDEFSDELILLLGRLGTDGGQHGKT
jgi:hypothetical protein